MSEAQLTDQELIKHIKQGGYAREKALAQVFMDQESQNKVKYIINSNKGNDQDAEDIFAEGLIVLDRSIRQNKFRGDSSISVYLVSICKYLWMNRLRKMGRIQWTDDTFVLDHVEYTNPEDLLLSGEQKIILDDLLVSLGKKCEEILRMWMLHYSMREIAETLSLTNESIARKNKYRCFQKLKEIMKDHSAFKEV